MLLLELRTQTFEDLTGKRHPFGVAFEADFLVAGEDLDAERVADLPEVLVTTPEDRQFLVVTFQRDNGFRHCGPFAREDRIRPPLVVDSARPGVVPAN